MVLFCVADPWAGQWSSFVLMIPGQANGPLLCQCSLGRPMVLFCVNVHWAGQWSSFVSGCRRPEIVICNFNYLRDFLFFSKIHILGSFQNIKIARTAICSLILGK